MAQATVEKANGSVKAKSAKKGCQVIEPEVCSPAPKTLAQLDEADLQLLERLLSEPAEYVAHELFDKATAERHLFGDDAFLGDGATQFTESPSEPLSNDSVQGTLTTAQEILLFQRFNYARMRIADLVIRYRHRRIPLKAVRELLAWARRAMQSRGQIVGANMPLVLAMAKRTRLSGLDFNELVSEGNFALLRSAEKFDCARGFKFSTYACRAILKSFSRVALRTSRYRGHFPTEYDPAMEKSDFVDNKRIDAESNCVDEVREILTCNTASLSDVEQTVIRERFGIDADADTPKGKTLEQVGDMIGVTKERVRQIQNKALAKIRNMLKDSIAA